jgi:ectoine hydroxylase-related dioxygenase (phytanoyl-CoA dioxygenase family)
LLDIHHLSRPLRQAILAPAVTDFLGLLFDSPVLLAESQGFLRDPTTGPRQDSAIAGFSPPHHFVSAWIALEDADPATGAPFVCPGSHRLPDFLFAGRYKSMQEARRAGHADLSRDCARHAALLAAAAGPDGFETLDLRPAAGSVVIRHPDLVHGGTPPEAMATRRGLAARLCPRYAMPLYAERLAVRPRPHDGHGTMTGIYPELELLD